MRPSVLVAFDVDGTLVDSAEGILGAIAAAYESVGAPIPSADELRGWIGPPINDRLAHELQHLGDEAVGTAQIAFRDRYRADGARLSALYPGIREMLASLADLGVNLTVATNKPVGLTNDTLAEHGISQFFEVVDAQQEGAPRVPKETMLGRLPEAEYAFMVGDRAEDMIAADRASMRGVGVGWGYGSVAELKLSGAGVVVASPHELVELVRVPAGQ